VRAHPAMAPLWRLGAAVLSADDHRAAAERFRDALAAESDGVARAAEYAIPRRAVVLTHSASSNVVNALIRNRRRVRSVLCTVSLPGGEGRAIARRLERAGFESEVVSDAAIASAAERADVALVGADAVTEDGAVNKVGTRLLALAAADAEIGFYVLAGTSKLLPSRVWRSVELEATTYEETPLGLIDAVVAEHGAMGGSAVRRRVRRIEIPRSLTARKALR
ncbi:MAG: hypothetical protein L0221_01525, partial [Chloroflexi bacterium]|nr:hypothetical protein [Chloroflexota bacterium]